MRDEAAVLGRLKMVATLGIQFLDINRLPLRINALPLRHAFVSPQSLYNIVTRHLIFQAILLLPSLLCLPCKGLHPLDVWFVHASCSILETPSQETSALVSVRLNNSLSKGIVLAGPAADAPGARAGRCSWHANSVGQ